MKEEVTPGSLGRSHVSATESDAGFKSVSAQTDEGTYDESDLEAVSSPGAQALLGAEQQVLALKQQVKGLQQQLSEYQSLLGAVSRRGTRDVSATTTPRELLAKSKALAAAGLGGSLGASSSTAQQAATAGQEEVPVGLEHVSGASLQVVMMLQSR